MSDYGNLKIFEVKHYGLGHGRWCSGALKEQDASVAQDVLPSAELVEQCSTSRLVDELLTNVLGIINQ